MIEAVFGVTLPDGERTLGELIDAVHQSVAAGDPAQRWFVAMCAALQEIPAYAALHLRRSTLLDQLFPWSTRRGAWSWLARRLQVALPPLRRPRELLIGVLWIGPFVGATFGMVLHLIAAKQRQGASLALPIAVGAGVFLVVSLAAYALTGPLAREFPANAKTLDDLAKLLAKQGDIVCPREMVAGVVRSLEPSSERPAPN